jgi:hypothetical protein
VLGCAVTRTFERDGVAFAVSLTAGTVQLRLTHDNGARGADRAKGEGMSLRMTTSQDIDALAEAIQARGGVLDAPRTSAAPRLARRLTLNLSR